MDALPSKLLKSDAATSSLVPLVRRTTLETLHAFATDSRAGEAGGAGRDRTDDPLLAKQVLSQLSYSPAYALVGLDGFEPSTPALSRRCSNQLSYKPGSGMRLSRARFRLAATDRLWAPEVAWGVGASTHCWAKRSVP